MIKRLAAGGDPQSAKETIRAWMRDHIPKDAALIGSWFEREMIADKRSDVPTVKSDYRAMAFQVFLEEWGGQQGESAAVYLEALQELQLVTSGFEKFIIAGWMKSDMKAALEYVWREPADLKNETVDRTVRRVGYFCDEFWQQSPERFMDWIGTNVGNWKNAQGGMDPRMHACVVRMGALATGDTLAGAGDLLHQSEKALDYSEVFLPFIKSYTQERPKEALQWALASPSPENAPELVKDTLIQVMRSDPDEGIQMMDSLTANDAKAVASSLPWVTTGAVDQWVGAVVKELADSYASDDRYLLTAIKSLNSISDPELRAQTRARVKDAIQRVHTSEALKSPDSIFFEALNESHSRGDGG
jgi:hypothetical protein